jgi:hypothetical protein
MKGDRRVDRSFVRLATESDIGLYIVMDKILSHIHPKEEEKSTFCSLDFLLNFPNIQADKITYNP